MNFQLHEMKAGFKQTIILLYSILYVLSFYGMFFRCMHYDSYFPILHSGYTLDNSLIGAVNTTP